MSGNLPGYVEERIRRIPPSALPVVHGSTPVISFGNMLGARVATLGWNPSKLEFLGSDNRELAGHERRLETLASLREVNLAHAEPDSVRRVFDACSKYFDGRPYRWFNTLEKVLAHLGASYYDGSACHLDLVQWATDPVWGKLSQTSQKQLLIADLPFLKQQLSQRNLEVLLLNGRGICTAYEDLIGGRLRQSAVSDHSRLCMFTGSDRRGFVVVGWNINLQSSPGVSNREIEAIGMVAREEVLRHFPCNVEALTLGPSNSNDFTDLLVPKNPES